MATTTTTPPSTPSSSSISQPFTNQAPGQASALVILNTDCIGPLFYRLWDMAALRICADGGANRLHDSLNDMERKHFVPDVIKGDLDSVRPPVADFYRSLGTSVVKDPNQNNNDVEKCLDTIKLAHLGPGKQAVLPPPESCNVFVLGGLGPRFDHAMANLHLLYKYTPEFNRLILFGHESTATLLFPGRHVLFPDLDYEGPICGLIPVGGICRRVTTKGLRWNLTEDRLSFGGLVSTSNMMEPLGTDSTISIENSDPLVWTTSIKPEWRKQIFVSEDGVPPSSLTGGGRGISGL